MKTLRRKNQSGFSLIELMVVIAVIITLTGMVIAALPGIQRTINRSNTKNFLAELKNGLSSYEIDNGIYPQVPSGAERNARGLEGSQILYKHLSGDYDEDGEVDYLGGDTNQPDEKIYVDRLDHKSNAGAQSPRCVSTGQGYFVVDTFSSPVRYIADPPNVSQSDRTTFNPTYDLWSTVGADPDSKEFAVQAKFITNWQSN